MRTRTLLLPATLVIIFILAFINNGLDKKYMRFPISEIKIIKTPSDIETMYITDFSYIIDGNKDTISVNEFLSFEEIPIAIKGKRFKVSSKELMIKEGELYEIKEKNTLLITRYDDNNIKSEWDFDFKYYSLYGTQSFVLNKTNKNLYIDKQDYGSRNTEFKTLLIKPNELKSTPHLKYYFKEPGYREKVPEGVSGTTIYWIHY